MSNLYKCALIAIMAVSIGGCASRDKRAEAPKEPTAAEKAVSQLDKDRDAYVAATKQRVDAMTKFGSDLEAKSEAADKVRAKKMQNASEDLKSLLEDVNKELADVRQAAPENWVDEKRDVDQAMSRAETQYSNSVQLIR